MLENMYNEGEISLDEYMEELEIASNVAAAIIEAIKYELRRDDEEGITRVLS